MPGRGKVMTVRYEYFGPEGERRSHEYDHEAAQRIVGSRAMTGWPVTHRWVDGVDESSLSVTWFTGHGGRVWSLLYEELGS